MGPPLKANLGKKLCMRVVGKIELLCCFLITVLDFPGGSDGKASVYNAGDLGSIPELGRFPGEGNGNPL